MAKTFDELANRIMTKAERKQADVQAKELLATMFLKEVRQLVGLNQSQLAKRLGVRQPNISKIEANEEDMQVETLRRIVEALGGELDVIARFPKASVKLTASSSDSKKTPKNNKALQLV